MTHQKPVHLDDESLALLNSQPRSFNFSKFVRDMIKEKLGEIPTVSH